MSRRSVVIILVIVVLLIVGAFVFWYTSQQPQATGVTTIMPTSTAGTTASSTNIQQLTLAGGQLSISYPADKFNLTTAGEPLLARAYIPPCDPGFDYCFYANSSTYAGTNFESAGLRIKNRTDLKTQTACLNTQPTGYQGLKPIIASSTSYAASTFPSLGNAGAGHVAFGDLYRLAVGNNCYEFETRIGNSQFANYPPGTIKEFTDANRSDMQNSLMRILNSLTITSSGLQVMFPISPQPLTPSGKG